jgi:L-asparaginase/Glu-tRNA(Gln) amidotransferase subunit D
MRPVGTVGISYSMNWALIREKPYRPLSLKAYFCQDVAILRIFPGEFTTIDKTLQSVKGLVLQTFGAGNAPEIPAFLAQLKAASDRGVVIVNVTQCHQGEVKAHYAAGTALVEAGVLPAVRNLEGNFKRINFEYLYSDSVIIHFVKTRHRDSNTAFQRH